MTVMTTSEYHRAAHRVARWCEWYTRGLAPDVAEVRRDEIASDLYEHGVYADEIGATPRALRRSIVMRAVRGIPADLSWRFTQARASRDGQLTFRSRLATGSLPAFAYAMAAVLFIGGGYILARVGMSLLVGDLSLAADLPVTVLVAVLAAGCGIGLLLRVRTRAMGAVWLAFAAYGIVRFGGGALGAVSETFSRWSYAVSGWDIFTLGIAMGTMLFFFSMALWWLPEDATSGDMSISGDMSKSGEMPHRSLSGALSAEIKVGDNA